QDWTGPQKLGNVYELRRYTLMPNSAPEVLKRWGAKIEGRVALSPLAGCWTSAGAGGSQNILYHLWPYESVEHRSQVRAESVAKGLWPPGSAEFYQRMENKLLIPASFSPLH
ncbi:MAG: NIPSNAP family protein, partial [Dehalococcoidia bacterium]